MCATINVFEVRISRFRLLNVPRAHEYNLHTLNIYVVVVVQNVGTRVRETVLFCLIACDNSTEKDFHENLEMLE